MGTNKSGPGPTSDLDPNKYDLKRIATMDKIADAGLKITTPSVDLSKMTRDELVNHFLSK